MKTAAELMTKDPILLEQNTDIHDAAHKFAMMKITSCPIVDENKNPIGILTEMGLMKAILLEQSKQIQGKSIREFSAVLNKISTIPETAAFDRVLRELLAAPAQRLLVINVQGTIVGIISPKDVLRYLHGNLETFRNADRDVKGVQQKLGSKANASIEDAVHLYQNAFENCPCMMHSIDAHGKLLLANAKLHETLGYAPRSLIGKTFKDIYLEKYHMQAEDGLRALVKGAADVVDGVMTSMKTKSGQAIPVEIRSSSIKNGSGEFMGTISIARRLDADAGIKSIMDLIGVFDDTQGRK